MKELMELAMWLFVGRIFKRMEQRVQNFLGRIVSWHTKMLLED
jgi:hypothetical protein